MRFFWGGHFEFSKSAILNFFLLHLCEKSSPFIWGIIFFCTMDGFSRILEKKLSELLCTRLYVHNYQINIWLYLSGPSQGRKIWGGWSPQSPPLATALLIHWNIGNDVFFQYCTKFFSIPLPCNMEWQKKPFLYQFGSAY